MKWHTLWAPAQALGPIVLMFGAMALADDGPVLPGLDSLGVAPPAGLSPSRKDATIPRAGPPVRPNPAALEQVGPEPSEIRARGRNAQGEGRETGPNARQPLGNRQQIGGDREAIPRDEKQLRQNRSDFQRSRQYMKRDPAGAAPGVPRQRSNSGDMRPTQPGLPNDRREQKRDWGDLERDKRGPPRQSAASTSKPRGLKSRRQDNAPSKDPQANGAYPPSRAGRGPVGRATR